MKWMTVPCGMLCMVLFGLSGVTAASPLDIFSDRPSHPKVVIAGTNTDEKPAVQPGQKHSRKTTGRPSPLSVIGGKGEAGQVGRGDAAPQDAKTSLSSRIYRFFFNESEDQTPPEELNLTQGTEANQSYPVVPIKGPKTIYLTFDDGPVHGTINVLRVLRDEKIKATMFLVGRQVAANYELFLQMKLIPDVLLANHTYSHADGHYRRFYAEQNVVLQDIAKAQSLIGGQYILRLAGRNVWRLPSVHRNDRALGKKEVAVETPVYDALEKRGYRIYGWDIEWGFDHRTSLPLYSPEAFAYKVARHYLRHTVKPGKIVVLAHDYMFRDKNGTQRLTAFIDRLKKEGWSFETMESY